jgi:mannose-1-phosphate guanylyltransferase
MPIVPEAIILCGGEGLRLRIVTSGPKAMASVAGRPFLELLLRQLRRHGIQRVILAVGYQSDVIRSHFGERVFGLQLAYSIELIPLGTGGALRNAAHLIESDMVLVMNGDSYIDADLQALAIRHRESRADASVLVVPADERDDCGGVSLGSGNRLVAFKEKRKSPDARYMNAGVYILSREMFDDIPPGIQVSLEQEVFPRWLGEGRHVQAIVDPGACIDIGTPERYWSAQDNLAGVEEEWMPGF